MLPRVRSALTGTVRIPAAIDAVFPNGIEEKCSIGLEFVTQRLGVNGEKFFNEGIWREVSFPHLVNTNSDTEMTSVSMATGGPLGSTEQNLWCLSAGATDESGPVPPEEITIGSLGHPDKDGNLWVLLPDND